MKDLSKINRTIVIVKKQLFLKYNIKFKYYKIITNFMIINRNTWKMLTFFFNNPYTETHLREISRITQVSIFSVKMSVDYLVSLNLLMERKVGRMRYVKPNMDNLFFKYLKISFSIKKIIESALIEHLLQNIPGIFSIVLFGSVAKGEDDKNSDLDLLIIGQRTKKLNFTKFENKIGRKIKPIVMKWSEWKKESKKNKPFYLEVITAGIPLHGSLPVTE